MVRRTNWFAEQTDTVQRRYVGGGEPQYFGQEEMMLMGASVAVPLWWKTDKFVSAGVGSGSWETKEGKQQDQTRWGLFL